MGGNRNKNLKYHHYGITQTKIKPNNPSKEYLGAFVEWNGAPIEFI